MPLLGSRGAAGRFLGASGRRQSAPVERAAPPAPPPVARTPPVNRAPAAASSAARSRRRDVADFDPAMSPTFEVLKAELEADRLPFRIGLVDESLVADVFRTYADSAAARTIGNGRSAWRKWKTFCARHHIERVWRNDGACNSGAERRCAGSSARGLHTPRFSY